MMKWTSVTHTAVKKIMIPAAVIFFLLSGHSMADDFTMLPTYHDDAGTKTSPRDFADRKEIPVIPKTYSFQAMVSLDLGILTSSTGNALFQPNYAAAGLMIEQDVYKGLIGIELFLRSNDDEKGSPFVSYTTGDIVQPERHIYDQYGAGIRCMFPNEKVLFPYASVRWVHTTVKVRFSDPYEAVSVSSKADGFEPLIGVDIHVRKTVNRIRPFFNFNMEMGYEYMPVLNMNMLGTIDVSGLWFNIGIGIMFQ